nr:Chain C, Lymphocyte-specific protein 1 [Homo sapiens]
RQASIELPSMAV